MKEETEEEKQARIELLRKGIEISKSGYGGVDRNGNVVDRREHPSAVPIQKNSIFGTPEPLAVICQRCKRDLATDRYSDLIVCEHCFNHLNDEFDKEYR